MGESTERNLPQIVSVEDLNPTGDLDQAMRVCACGFAEATSWNREENSPKDSAYSTNIDYKRNKSGVIVAYFTSYDKWLSLTFKGS